MSPQEHTSRSLIDQVTAAAAGSREAFEKVFEAHYPAVFAAAWVRLGNNADAEDAAQETFIEAWRKLPRLRDAAKFPGLLRRIVIGRCGRITRRPKLCDGHVEAADQIQCTAPGPAAIAERNDTAGVASRALAMLPRAQRETMALFAAGCSYRDVAAALGVPLGTVKRRIHDSRKALEESMGELAIDALRRRARRAQAKLHRSLRIRKETSRMKALLKAVSSATLDAVSEMYQTCDRIELADGKINGESVHPWVWAAVTERVRVNANLAGEAFKPGARSQILVQAYEQKWAFDVEVGPQRQLLLTRRT